MSRVTFEKYGELANSDLPDSIISGRYRMTEDNEIYAIDDIREKLCLTPDDDLLDIGCGPGNMLIPLSFFCKSATGIDHPNTIKRLNDRFPNSSINTIGCNFLDYNNAENLSFNKILIYSVIAALADKEEAFRFIDKALTMLKPGGSLLLGDIANTSKKERFVYSEFGKEFNSKWMEERNKNMDLEDVAASVLCVDDTMFSPNDIFVSEIFSSYRKKGYEVYVLPQPKKLPFGYTREDILIMKLA